MPNKKFGVTKYSLTKVVKVFQPDLTLYEQREWVESIWKKWVDTLGDDGKHYDREVFFILFLVLTMAGVPELVESIANDTPTDVRAAFWMLYALQQECLLVKAEEEVEALFQVNIDSVDRIVELLDKFNGDTDRDPRIPIGNGICGDPDCFICGRTIKETSTQELDDA